MSLVTLAYIYEGELVGSSSLGLWTKGGLSNESFVRCLPGCKGWSSIRAPAPATQPLPDAHDLIAPFNTPVFMKTKKKRKKRSVFVCPVVGLT